MIIIGDRYRSVEKTTHKLIGVLAVVFANPRSLKQSHQKFSHHLEPRRGLVAVG